MEALHDGCFAQLTRSLSLVQKMGFIAERTKEEQQRFQRRLVWDVETLLRTQQRVRGRAVTTVLLVVFLGTVGHVGAKLMVILGHRTQPF